jgi:hypothetical protein
LSETLDRVVDEIAAAPQSAAALTLYALVSTLEFEQAGFLFKLIKLRDLTPEQRKLAYQLIELMAQNANAGIEWDRAKERMDNLVRGE